MAASDENLSAAPDWAEAAETRVLDAALGLAATHGWGADLARAAGVRAGLSAAETELLLPGGARDLAALLSRRHDARALAVLATTDPAALKIRERIRTAVMARAEAAATDGAAVKRCVAYLSLPPNLPLGLQLAWESADRLWRWAGDTATDENHYSKRAILSGVLINTVAARLNDGEAAAAEVLDRRIGQVMDFEKWKANLPRPLETLKGFAAAMGRVRYR